ncbi:DUF2892 domain-containing protein [Arcobacter sp. LA11]|uniref:YgaP family membrane protein n=1 Tax=Arcobacter sp. LA11 TaxID=1898176 RepID=UPI0009322818|nr:DUF2892 domain-containing protein [Arcobacter sp. LA11]
MNKNLGKVDRTLRIIIGIVIIVFGVINNSWLGLIGVIPIFTALISWCPLYCPLKINTCSKKECDL